MMAVRISVEVTTDGPKLEYRRRFHDPVLRVGRRTATHDRRNRDAVGPPTLFLTKDVLSGSGRNS